jgi:dTMP kinase
MLITIEGIDGSGKSTLHNTLCQALDDLHPIKTREPGSTWIGETVRKAIKDKIDPVTEALLFVADHAAHLHQVIKPALSEGKIVISDRYIDSRFAYQQVTLEGVIPEPLTWLKTVHKGWTVNPDLTLLLTIPIDIALERTKNRKTREHFEEKEILNKVQKNYLDLVEREPWRFVILDGTLPAEQILNVAENAVRNKKEIFDQKHKKRSKEEIKG